MRNLILLAALLMLTGCASLSPVASALKQRAASANDKALIAAENVICKDVSIGAILRRYGSGTGRAAAWRGLCLDNTQGEIVK